MTRAAIMPTPGDPFLNKLWFKLFTERWQDEVDSLYVLLDSKIEKPVVEFLRKMYTSNPKVKFFYVDHMIEHGQGLLQLLNHVEEDLVMLVEDDGLIFQSGAVKEQFDRIEAGEFDVIGGHRQSATPDIATAVQHTFYTESIEAFLWPNFLFTKTQYLKNTDGDFGARRFKAGEVVPILNQAFMTEQAMDTFGWATIQLYNQNLNVEFIEQYHAMSEDLEYAEKGERMWDGKCKWTHLGSLSSMMTNFLYSEDGYPLESRTHPDKVYKDPLTITNSDGLENEGTKKDFESRIAHLMLAFELTEKECDEIADFREQYKKSLERVIPLFRLRMEYILGKQRLFKDLMKL